MAAVADEIGDVASGGRIQKIVQPSEFSVGMQVYADGERRWLVLSAHPQLARAHVASDKLSKAFSTPSSFVMLLRKYLEGSRIDEVAAVRGERILRLACHRLGGKVQFVAEVMAKHSNVILLDDTARIPGAVKIVCPRLS